MNSAVTKLAALCGYRCPRAELGRFDVQSHWDKIRALRIENNSRFAKGDDVLWLTNSDREGVASFWVRRVKLTSLGKKQGTAVYVEAGKNVQDQVYTEGSVLLRNEDEVREYVAAYGLDLAISSLERAIEIDEEWISSHRHVAVSIPHIPKVEARIAAHKAIVPHATITYR